MLIRDSYIVGRSFYYDLKIESSISYDCESYGCDDEGVCRCGQIDKTKIKNINITKIVDKIYEDIYGIDDRSTKRDNKLSLLLEGFGKEMNIYTIDRILRIHKVYDPNNWIVEVDGGYYGQEIGDVIINDDLAKKLEEKIFEALSIDSLTERVEYLLNLEYGSILPDLQDSLYEIMDVKKDDLYFGSISNKNSTLKEIENSSTEFYGYYYDDSNYGRDSIKGVVIEKDGKYRVIDGYHRCLASERKHLKVLVAKKILKDYS